MPALPGICLVSANEDFHEEIIPELLPWFHVDVRESYADLARWVRRSEAVGILIDIDSDGPDPFAGVPILGELRRLDESLVHL